MNRRTTIPGMLSGFMMLSLGCACARYDYCDEFRISGGPATQDVEATLMQFASEVGLRGTEHPCVVNTCSGDEVRIFGKLPGDKPKKYQALDGADDELWIRFSREQRTMTMTAAKPSDSDFYDAIRDDLEHRLSRLPGAKVMVLGWCLPNVCAP